MGRFGRRLGKLQCGRQLHIAPKQLAACTHRSSSFSAAGSHLLQANPTSQRSFVHPPVLEVMSCRAVTASWWPRSVRSGVSRLSGWCRKSQLSGSQFPAHSLQGLAS